jgi:transcriptional regulator with XRE-family HTH domain
MREARRQAGLTQAAFGAKIGVSGQQVQKYERGKDLVPLHRLLTISAIFGTPPEKFWGEEDRVAGVSEAPEPDDSSTMYLVRAYKRIADANVRKRVLDLIKQLAGVDENFADS